MIDKQIKEEDHFNPEAFDKEIAGVKGDPKSRLGTKKMGFDHLPVSTLVNLSPQTASGAVKYGKKNWIRTDPCHKTSVYCNAVLRHMILFMAGQDKTSDSNQSHLKAIMAGLSVYLDSERLGTVIDDRIKYPSHYIEQLEKDLNEWEYPEL